MRRWRHYLKMYGQIQLQNMKSLAEYRADFLMMLFFTGFSQICNLGVLGIIYSNIPAVGGRYCCCTVFCCSRRGVSIFSFRGHGRSRR